MEHGNFISVILPLKLEWEPCYSLPEGTKAFRGDRVKVIFAGRTYTGVVSSTDIVPQTDTSRIKDILSIEKDMGRISPQEMDLWRNVSEYYLCSIGEVYKAAYPYGKMEMEEAKAASVRKMLEREQLRKERTIEKLTARKDKLKERADRNIILASKSRKDSTRATYLAAAETANNEIRQIDIRLREISTAEQDEKPVNTQTKEYSQTLVFSAQQEQVIQEIKRGFEYGKPVLLHGVTGSGKTEIYMKLAQETLAKKRNVLYLVPEIALSRQLEERLRIVFGEKLLVFHSGETSASRRDVAGALRSDQEYIVLGTRSSIFLPHTDLGLIIVDEEHDNSYKQDSPAPRYNGRDTALMLSSIHDCRIILGSATPSLEEQYNCRIGRHILVRLDERYHGSSDAEIEIIDTKAERKKNGMAGNFSRRLIGYIQKTLSEGGQVLILRSHRAWSPVMQCKQCGEIQKCPHCNVSLSLHNDGSIRCHYCGSRFSNTGRCIKCGGAVANLGAGTQKIEEEATALFPYAKIARLDSDISQNRNKEKKIIRDFSEGNIDILIGTQMISKGFDFSNLSLVAVIAADSLLGIQDFRADERAHQLLKQLCGRCGRRSQRGKFVIQTASPDHPVYRNIIDEDKGFSENLLSERKDFNFPPYTRMIEISIRDRFCDRGERMAVQLATEIRREITSSRGFLDDPVTGPYSPAIDRIADQHIRTIRISLRKSKELTREKASLKKIVNDFEKRMKYEGHITINVDPS